MFSGAGISAPHFKFASYAPVIYEIEEACLDKPTVTVRLVSDKLT